MSLSFQAMKTTKRVMTVLEQKQMMAITNFRIELFKYWFTLYQFAMEDPVPCHEGHDQARTLIDGKFELTFVVTQKKVQQKYF